MQSYEIPTYKVQLVRDSHVDVPEKKVMSPETASDIVRRYLHGADRENLVVLLLDTHLDVIGINTVSVGSVNATVAAPREIFKPAILAGAHGIILAHNHPSGDPKPSAEDRVLHKRIRECGRLMQIELLDAIIIGHGFNGTPGQFYSAKRENAYEF